MASDVVPAVEMHSVVIVRGNTGCGKTTQVPQFLLDNRISMGLGAGCNIVVTQVRVCVHAYTMVIRDEDVIHVCA